MNKIKLYTTRMCPNCDKVKNFLDENKIDYELIDAIDLMHYSGSENENVIEFLKVTNKTKKVPVIIEPNGHVITGYEEQELIKRLLNN